VSGRWKEFERKVAAALGGRRRPVTGIDRDDGDCFTDELEIQAKHRLSQPPPQCLLAWLEGIRRTAEKRGKVGVVVWKRPGVADVERSLVVMEVGDFRKLLPRTEIQPVEDE
jgi:hypothetical protein